MYIYIYIYFFFVIHISTGILVNHCVIVYKFFHINKHVCYNKARKMDYYTSISCVSIRRYEVTLITNRIHSLTWYHFFVQQPVYCDITLCNCISQFNTY